MRTSKNNHFFRTSGAPYVSILCSSVLTWIKDFYFFLKRGCFLATEKTLSICFCPLSVHDGCEQGSPPRLWCTDGRLSRSCSSENHQTSSLVGGCVGGGGSDWPKKEAEENKENVRLDQCFSNTSGLPMDLDGWNESVISGGFEDQERDLQISTHIFLWLCLLFQIKGPISYLRSDFFFLRLWGSSLAGLFIQTSL